MKESISLPLIPPSSVVPSRIHLLIHQHSFLSSLSIPFQFPLFKTTTCPNQHIYNTLSLSPLPSLFSSPFLSSLSLSSSHLLPFSSLPFPSITSSLALPCHSTHSASDCGAAEGPLSSVSGRLPPQGPALAEPLAHTGCPCALRAAPPGGVLSPTSQHVRTGEAESQGVEGDMHASCSCSFVC